jgi:very-short-patch-repair endonuclease
MTIPQQLLLESLEPGWIPEHPVPVKQRRPDLPTCLYLDLAIPIYKFAIEVDGGTHRMTIWKQRDAKKEAYLRSLGWTVLRFWNKDILSWKASGMPMESYISTTLQQHGIHPIP